MPGLTEGLPIEIILSTEPWEQIDVDAFVVPTNSRGLPKHYPTSKFIELTGMNLAREIQPHTPLAIGSALVTAAGKMRARHLIHVPDTEEPGGRVQVEDVLRATSAVLVACQVRGFNSIAVPLMGAFDRGIPAEEAARAIHSQIRSHRGDRPTRVTLAATTPDEVEVFELAMEGVS